MGRGNGVGRKTEEGRGKTEDGRGRPFPIVLVKLVFNAIRNSPFSIKKNAPKMLVF